MQARMRSTYGLRIGWGIGGVGLLLMVFWAFPSESANGRFVLTWVHLCLVTMLLVLASFGAADSISREKREGTLGLLLMTHMKPSQLVFGKAGMHLIRSVYLSFTFIPFLTIPVLLGGVTAEDFLFSAAVLVLVAVSGVASGLIASAVAVRFGTAATLALILGSLAACSMSGLVAAVLAFPSSIFFQDASSWWRLCLLGPGIIGFPAHAVAQMSQLSTRPRLVVSSAELGLVLLAFFFLFVAIRFAAYRVHRYRESTGETAREAAFRRWFLTPLLWRGAFRRIVKSKLERNPLVWLEYRSAWARSARWAMILLLVLAESLLLVNLPGDSDLLRDHLIMLTAVLAFMTLKSSSSFQQEKETGAFELLLVTPLTEREIVAGRLNAVANYYWLPLILLWAFTLLGLTPRAWAQRSLPFSDDNLTGIINLLSLSLSFFSVPVCGLFFALRTRTFAGALLWTAGLAVLAPIFFSMAFQAFISDEWWVWVAIVLYHLGLVRIFRGETHQLLRKREFAGVR